MTTRAAPVGVGSVLAGKYRVEHLLGEGGMGVVVSATHLQLGGRVAIKFLLPEGLKDEGCVARFLREAQAAAKIHSEHIARAYDVGTLEGGAPYIVMEYLYGSDLNELVKKHGPLPINIVAEYGLQICEALAAAHVAGIVHRDLKPSNIFVTTRSDGSPLIKVIDFGISKILAPVENSLSTTRTDEIRGSPFFMAPEQMRRTRDANARSDIWSLGVTLYNLLSGSYPFCASSVMELCSMIFQDEPAPLRAKRADVPPALEAVVLRCLRKDPAQRYKDVAELAAALVEFAPTATQSSAERIERILRGTCSSGRASLPSVTSIDRPATKLEIEDLSTSDHASSSAALSGLQKTMTSPGSTSPSIPRASVLLLVGLSGVFIVAAGAAFVFLLRPNMIVPGQSSVSVVASSSLEETPSAPAAPPIGPIGVTIQTAVPSNSLAERPEILVEPSPSAKSQDNVVESTSPTTGKPLPNSSHQIRKPAISSVPQQVSKPKTDLFSTRK